MVVEKEDFPIGFSVTGFLTKETKKELRLQLLLLVCLAKEQTVCSSQSRSLMSGCHTLNTMPSQRESWTKMAVADRPAIQYFWPVTNKQPYSSTEMRRVWTRVIAVAAGYENELCLIDQLAILLLSMDGTALFQLEELWNQRLHGIESNQLRRLVHTLCIPPYNHFSSFGMSTNYRVKPWQPVCLVYDKPLSTHKKKKN